MNKIAVIFLLLIGLLFTGSVFAQRQIQDYTYQYEKYRTQYDEYTVAKNEFLKQNTLTSQREALDKTKAIVTQRAQALRAYLLALKFTLAGTTGIPNDDKAELSANLDDEVGWLQNHIDDLTGMGNPTMSDLFEVSARLERRYKQIVAVSYRTTSHILIGRVRQTNQDLTNTNAVLQPLVEQYKNSFLKNWYDQAVDMSYKCDQSITNALLFVTEMKEEFDEDDGVELLANVKAELTRGKAHLINGVGFQNEILKELNKVLPNSDANVNINQPVLSQPITASPSAD